MKTSYILEPLMYKGNEKSKLTLHLFFQIIGKIRMSKTPRKNHWWYTTMYVDVNGFTTDTIPFNESETFKITLNVLKNLLEVEISNGAIHSFELHSDLSVAQFYKNLTSILNKNNIFFSILDKPFDIPIDSKFDLIEDIHHYSKEYTYQLWKTMLWVDLVFKEFSGRSYAKTCPVHLYWHSMDLTVTRFSGKKAPKMPSEARISDKDAYSHEVISFGFWAGDENVPEPAFYSYTFPSPNAIELETILPSTAKWVENNGSQMAILKYNDLIQEDNPKKSLLDFMESTYQAGAKLAKWNIEDFKVPELKDL